MIKLFSGPIPFLLLGMLVTLSLAGITPWHAASLLDDVWPALKLVLFWAGVALAVVAAYAGTVMLYAWLSRDGVPRWPWDMSETGTALLLALVVLGISGETFPANVVKYSGFQVVLPLLAVLVVALPANGAGYPGAVVRSLYIAGGVLAAYLLALTLWRGDLPRGALLLNRLWFYAMWFLLLGRILRPGAGLEHLQRFLIVLALFVTGYGIMQHFGLDWAEWGRGFSLPDIGVSGRAISTFGNPNFYGAFLVVLLPLAVIRCLNASRPAARLTWGVGSILLVAGLLLTFNRAGYLAAAAGFVVIAWLLPLPRRVIWYLAIAVLLLLVLGPSSLRDRVVFWQNGLSGDDQIRCAIWQAAMNMALDSPLCGHGPGTFNQSAMRFFPYAYHAIYPRPVYVIEHAHSELLEWWAETGAVGSGLTAVLVAPWLLALWRGCTGAYRLPVLAALTAATGAAVHGLFETKLRYESTAVPLLFILAAALVRPQPSSPPVRSRMHVLWCGVIAAVVMLQGLVWLRGNQEMKAEVDHLLVSQLPQAQQAIARAARFDPQNLHIQYKTLLYQDLGQDSVMVQVQMTLPAVADYQDGALLLARLLARQGEVWRGLACLDRYATLYPHDDRLPTVRAELCAGAGLPRGVLEVLDGAVGGPHAERVVMMRGEAWKQLGLPDVAVNDYQRAVDRQPELLRPRLALTEHFLTEGELAAAYAQLRALMPQLSREGFTPAARQQIERFVNLVMGKPEFGRQVAVPVGDMLASARQYQQARIIYQQMAGSLGVAQETIWSRIGWLGLMAGDVGMLEASARFFAGNPSTVTTAIYLAGRSAELSGNSMTALARYEALLARQPLHLGALARVARVPVAARSALLQEQCRHAERILGVSLQKISDSDPRWVAAGMPPPPDTVARQVWLTSIFPDGTELDCSLAALLADGSERAGEWHRQRLMAGETLRLKLPAPAAAAEWEQQAITAQVLRCHAATGEQDLRPEARYPLGTGVLAAPRTEPVDTFVVRSAAALAAWLPRLEHLPMAAEQRAALRAAVDAQLYLWEQDRGRHAAWQQRYRRAMQSPQIDLGVLPLLTAVFTGERPVRQALLKLSLSGSPIAAAATAACLDECAVQDTATAPAWLWERPARLGLAGDYWQAWLNTAAAVSPGFRGGIATVLLRRHRPAEALALLRAGPPAETALRWPLVQALTAAGRDDEARALFASAAAATIATPRYQWDFGRWRRSRGEPVDEQVRLLRAAGADGWAMLLAGDVPRGCLPGFTPVELDDETIIAGLVSDPPKEGVLVRTVWLVAGGEHPVGFGTGLRAWRGTAVCAGGDWNPRPRQGALEYCRPSFDVVQRGAISTGAYALHFGRCLAGDIGMSMAVETGEIYRVTGTFGIPEGQ